MLSHPPIISGSQNKNKFDLLFIGPSKWTFRSDSLVFYISFNATSYLFRHNQPEEKRFDLRPCKVSRNLDKSVTPLFFKGGRKHSNTGISQLSATLVKFECKIGLRRLAVISAAGNLYSLIFHPFRSSNVQYRLILGPVSNINRSFHDGLKLGWLRFTLQSTRTKR